MNGIHGSVRQKKVQISYTCLVRKVRDGCSRFPVGYSTKTPFQELLKWLCVSNSFCWESRKRCVPVMEAFPPNYEDEGEYLALSIRLIGHWWSFSRGDIYTLIPTQPSTTYKAYTNTVIKMCGSEVQLPPRMFSPTRKENILSTQSLVHSGLRDYQAEPITVDLINVHSSKLFNYFWRPHSQLGIDFLYDHGPPFYVWVTHAKNITESLSVNGTVASLWLELSIMPTDGF